MYKLFAKKYTKKNPKPFWFYLLIDKNFCLFTLFSHLFILFFTNIFTAFLTTNYKNYFKKKTKFLIFLFYFSQIFLTAFLITNHKNYFKKKTKILIFLFYFPQIFLTAFMVTNHKIISKRNRNFSSFYLKFSLRKLLVINYSLFLYFTLYVILYSVVFCYQKKNHKNTR